MEMATHFNSVFLVCRMGHATTDIFFRSEWLALCIIYALTGHSVLYKYEVVPIQNRVSRVHSTIH